MLEVVGEQRDDDVDMMGSLSAMSTTLATSSAATVAPAMDDSCRPYARSINARSSSTM